MGVVVWSLLRGVGTLGPVADPTAANPTAMPNGSAPTVHATPGPLFGATLTAGPSDPPAAGRFPGGLLIADRVNNRLIVVDDAGNILWRFPVDGSLPVGESFSADDAFIAADHQTIVANEESNQVIVAIDIATQKVVWEYGTYGVHGSDPGQLWTPDDAYPLPDGNISVADIKNCRIVVISPDKQIVRQFGTTGVCAHNPPISFAHPNGDTPLPDGGMLVTEIGGSRVVRLSAAGDVVFDIHVPANYPSDAQLLPDGNVLVVDYSNPGAILVVDPLTDQVLYKYAPTSGDGRLNHPSLVVQLSDGTYLLNDDDRHRVVVVDPRTNSIVWSYGHTDVASSADGYLNLPDGIDVVPPGIFR